MRRTNMPPELPGKRLEPIKETIAKLSLGLCYGGVILLIQVRPQLERKPGGFLLTANP